MPKASVKEFFKIQNRYEATFNNFKIKLLTNKYYCAIINYIKRKEIEL